MMMTETTGRRPFQEVYLWTPSGRKTTGKGATTAKYDPSLDGSLAHPAGPTLPNNEELVPHE